MIARARAAAFEILLKIATTDAHSDDLLRGREVDALGAQDRALATTLTLGTLRWQLALDARIRPLLARPGARLPAPVEIALRLGAYQLLHLDRIPAHAAIGESVELAKRAGETHAAGMVNAVLRKIAREPRAEAAAEAAHPQWMVRRWARFYGRDAARAICEFDQQPAGICVRLAHPEAEHSLVDEGIALAPGEFLTAARRVTHGDVARSEAFRRGWVRIQDEGSQLVAELAGHGEKILDTCAAPGGKTAILAQRNPESAITAMDASRKRLEAMRRTFGESRVRFIVQDATQMQEHDEYDLILCDVPCTGTGTMGRNPEIRVRVSEAEVTRQRERQQKILRRALDALEPGGRLLYSTCSLEMEENEDVIAACAKQDGVELIPIESEIVRLEREGAIHAEGAARLRSTAARGSFLRTLPGIHGCDGFFAAVLAARHMRSARI